jgi:TRAP-type C4-dicarboxylate transport system permease small subunit
MQRVMAAIDRVVEVAVIVIFAAMIVIGTAQVFNRYFLNMSLSWSEEFQRYGQIWVVFLGIPVAYRRGMHIGMDMLDGHLSPRGKRLFSLLVDVLWLVLATAIIVGLSRLMPLLRMQHSPGLGLPMHWVYGGMLLGAFYMGLVALRRIAGNLAGRPLDPGYGES